MTRTGKERVPFLQRFWEKVRKTDDCWEWTAAGSWDGYGWFRPHGKTQPKVLVHRFAYELLRGPIPTGMQLDHLCRNRACVNPGHLEVVTATENRRRGLQRGSHRSTSYVRPRNLVKL